MAELIRDIDASVVRDNLARVREEIAATGRDPGDVELLAAVKYVPLEEIGVLAEAGVEVVGENRAQDLEAKSAAHPELTWDFIGHLQSRKVKQVLPHVRYVHSVASDSVLRQLERHGTPDTEVLVEVNISGEEGKSGIDPAQLDDFVARCPARVVGLMTMPPLVRRARRAGGRARPAPPQHGHLPGLPGRGPGRGHDRPPRHDPVQVAGSHNLQEIPRRGLTFRT